MKETTRILGIESSCDDTAAAIIDGRTKEVLSSVVFDQFELHEDFGGVVPEIAARAHAERLDICTKQALADANCTLGEIDAIAATAGPGLIGGVVSGLTFAKGLALSLGKPLLAVNHLAGHALTPRMTHDLPFPYLMFLVSGGHCQFLIVHSATKFERLGGTIDDAPGEAFDKTAKLLGLGSPGGPLIEDAALKGDATRFDFPRPMIGKSGCDMSFSGLKTAVRRTVDQLKEAQSGLYKQDQNDIAACFQTAVAEVMAAKLRRAMETYASGTEAETRYVAIAGGVAANKFIGNSLAHVAKECGFEIIIPPMKYCTDNAAMIAWAGLERLNLGLVDDFKVSARPRWPLDAAAAPMLGSGKKGAKA